jgi:hypothetical protein
MFPKKEFDPSAVAFELGDAAVNRAVENLECVCGVEKRRRELLNAPDIKSLGAELALRTEEHDELTDQIRRTPRRSLLPQRSRLWYVMIALMLGIAGFSFAHLALTPFGLGWETCLYSLAVATVCAVATDEVLEQCGWEKLVTGAAAVSFVAGLGGLLIMAFVRGDILLLYLKNTLSAGVADASPFGGIDAIRFYEAAAGKLRLFFALLAVAMELSTGLAIYKARRIGPRLPDVLAILEARLRLVETEMITLLHRIEFLKREPDIFESQFTRDFYLGLIQGAARRTSKHVGPFLGALVCVALLAPTLTAQRIDAVVGLDLSLSSAAKNYDGNLEYAKNVDGAARFALGLPAGARVRVLGITDQSFSRPLVLLSGEIPEDRGPLAFVDRIEVARRRLAAAMRDLGRTAPPKYPQTDVIGFLIVAGDLLHSEPRGRKVLVIFSDMRHSAPPPNIESPRLVSVAGALRAVEARQQIADLRAVDVYVYGVHAAGKDIPYWQSLRAFWEEYFSKAGATLKCFSMMREVPSHVGRLSARGPEMNGYSTN